MFNNRRKCVIHEIIMDKTEYEEKVNTMLNDAHTYEKLQADPTSSYKRKVIEKLTKISTNTCTLHLRPHPDCTAHQNSTRLTTL